MHRFFPHRAGVQNINLGLAFVSFFKAQSQQAAAQPGRLVHVHLAAKGKNFKTVWSHEVFAVKRVKGCAQQWFSVAASICCFALPRYLSVWLLQAEKERAVFYALFPACLNFAKSLLIMRQKSFGQKSVPECRWLLRKSWRRSQSLFACKHIAPAMQAAQQAAAQGIARASRVFLWP